MILQVDDVARLTCTSDALQTHREMMRAMRMHNTASGPNWGSAVGTAGRFKCRCIDRFLLLGLDYMIMAI